VIELSVVIPAYNEAPTIAATVRRVAGYLQAQPYTSELIVVDDGSRDGTGDAARAAATHPWIRVIASERNQGKGATVRRGMLEARGRHVFFMDADLSVPVPELSGALDALRAGPAPIVIGSRRLPGARIERRQPRMRELLGFGFTWLAARLLSPGILDFTCGFKGFRADVALMLFSEQKCTDWAFDAEILYLARLRGIQVRQYPVTWSHQANSRVRFPRDIWRTLVALVRIRMHTGIAEPSERPATEPAAEG
jgi:dolichyl-phosphate beta-glucosyltransferase